MHRTITRLFTLLLALIAAVPAVVYIKDPGYRGTLPVRHADMKHENETFIPRTLAVTKGSTVDFPNHARR